ncbi:NADP-binding protein [Dacryopinax primogenitus]|uniref:NADP-binding protein n=1 Tax=Dacryopinax primogenitus (strain DJM 731) TaxID=1858805 RepID=M5G6L9_DACPD|nr:NADP-binding protein [Dacryopinax primogenitus]EJU01467.1 NADP-binding protein [Dacryopinax primogenitus]
MSEFEHFVVLGSGRLGVFIIQELVALKKQGKIKSVVVFTRSNDSHERILQLGAKPVNVNYSNADQLVHALKGVDCVVSTLASNAVEFEKEVARACKVLEVKLFVHSEWGLPNVDHPGSRKGEVKKYLKEIKQPWAYFYTGVFIDLVFTPFAGFNWNEGKVSIGGSGNGQVSCTARTDIARYVAYVLINLPVEELENKAFRIEGERTTFNALFSAWESRTGRKLQITRTPREELEKRASHDFHSRLYLAIEDGDGVVGRPEETNLYWPEWTPKTVLQVVLD